MAFKQPIITKLGQEISMKNLFGKGNVDFYIVKIGEGYESVNPENLTDLKDTVMNATILDKENQSDAIVIEFTFDNSTLAEGFTWSEYGVFAKYTPSDPEEEELEGLYCYGYDDSETPEQIPAFTGSNSYYKARLKLTISIGNADNVTVNLGIYTDFVPQETFEAHCDEANPHNTTAADVGLPNVDNVSTNDATPTFTEASALTDIVSGEKASVLWGKVKKAISTIRSHVANKNNPHGVTLAQLGAAASNHSHDAGNIATGTLPITRGGTGGSTASAARSKLGINSLTQNKAYTSESISFTENQYVTTTIAISKIAGYKAVAIAAWQILNDGSVLSDKYITLNNITFNQTEVTVHLYNTKSGANHVRFWVSILYIKDI